MNLSILSAIFLTPIYTRMIPGQDYGIMDIFNTWNAMISNIIPFGMVSVVIMLYNDVKDQPEERRKTFGSITIFFGFVSAVFSLIAIGFQHQFLTTFIGKDTSRETEIYFANVIIIILTVFQSYVLWMLRAKFKKYHYLAVTVSNFLILSFGGFVLVYFLHIGIVGFFRASVLALLTSVALGLYFIREDLYLHFDFKKFKYIFSISIHFLSVLLLLKLVDVLGRFFLKEYSPNSLSDIGLYSIGVRIAGIIMFILSAFSTAWYPYALSIKNDPDINKKINKVHDLFYIVCTFIGIGILVFRSELILFFAPDYKLTYHIIPILLLTNIISQTNGIYALGLHYTKKTKYISYGALASMLTNVICSFLLINKLGVMGYALAGLISLIVWVGLQKYYAQKQFFLDFKYQIVWLCGTLYLAAAAASYAIDFQLQGTHLAYIISIKAILFVFILTPLGFFIYKKYWADVLALVQSIKSKL